MVHTRQISYYVMPLEVVNGIGFSHAVVAMALGKGKASE
jgi:hypothetical protein